MPLLNTTTVGGKATILQNANATYVVVGNNSVSNIASASENVQSASITRIYFSSSNNWVIARGANTVATLSGTGVWDLTNIAPISQDATANLVFTCNGNGTLLVEVHKTSVAL
jgi:hypothetical protein